ncbi:MAG: SUMF1/EgtB/PvdO family nonheme iron enzyme [Polyangiaceae bacterium]|nr:SUMF1/EgtB/PvdO family nonheme iron enzyme [Polyangiaceae bacterium]
MRPATIIALVFAGSAGVAALLFVLDAKERAKTAPSTSASAPVSTAVEVATAVPLPSSIDTSRVPPAPKPTSDAREAPQQEGPCPSDMVLVEADYCPFVAHRCAKERKPARPGEGAACERYHNEVICEGALVPLRYCIDTYEYPNRKGVLPAVLVSFDEAERSCAAEDKRLCTVREWSLACEGEAIFPYAVGLERTASACNWDAASEAAVAPTRGSTVAGAFALIDKRLPSGEKEACTSPFGVRDLAGNVAEWTYEPVNSKTTDPFASVVAGGAWGKGPAACRSLDDAHPPPHRAAAVGFRCCADAFGDAPEQPKGSARRKGSGKRPIAPPRGLP